MSRGPEVCDTSGWPDGGVKQEFPAYFNAKGKPCKHFKIDGGNGCWRLIIKVSTDADTVENELAKKEYRNVAAAPNGLLDIRGGRNEEMIDLSKFWTDFLRPFEFIKVESHGIVDPKKLTFHSTIE